MRSAACGGVDMQWVNMPYAPHICSLIHYTACTRKLEVCGGVCSLLATRCQIRVPNWKATSCGVWSRTGPFVPHFPSSPDILFRYIKVRMEMRWLPFSSPYIPRPQICQEKGTATKFNTTPLSRQLLLLYIQ